MAMIKAYRQIIKVKDEIISNERKEKHKFKVALGDMHQELYKLRCKIRQLKREKDSNRRWKKLFYNLQYQYNQQSLELRNMRYNRFRLNAMDENLISNYNNDNVHVRGLHENGTNLYSNMDEYGLESLISNDLRDVSTFTVSDLLLAANCLQIGQLERVQLEVNNNILEQSHSELLASIITATSTDFKELLENVVCDQQVMDAHCEEYPVQE